MTTNKKRQKNEEKKQLIQNKKKQFKHYLLRLSHCCTTIDQSNYYAVHYTELGYPEKIDAVFPFSRECTSDLCTDYTQFVPKQRRKKKN